LKTPIVLDSTCLIGLERLECLELLPRLFEPVFVPPEVAREIGTPLTWLTIKAPSDSAVVDALNMLVDSGEAEAIALARELQVKVVLDDRRARTVGERMGVVVLGTLGILIQAKRAGEIPAVGPFLERLEKVGFHMTTHLMEEALRLAGE
jgi:predicted nucleic acid-binding protein